MAAAASVSPGTVALNVQPPEVVAIVVGAGAALLELAAALEELEELAAVPLVALVAEPLAPLLVAALVAPAPGVPRAAGFWSLEHPAAVSSRPVVARAVRALVAWFRFMSTNLDSPLSGL
ncbi:hypothetical protein GCM10009838_74950 [Catenulispora subtropica]|uniref:Secreted protein n=1 Tax=Catenulispora subtropica TaxID=450798 RepID=A0ABN2T5U8_9ACTN